MTLLFTPPAWTSVPPILPRNGPDQSALARRLFRHYRSRPEGINVYLLSNGVVTEEHPDGETFFWAQGDGSPYVAYAFYGGHDNYELTEAQATLLSGAGYTVIDDSGPTETPPIILNLSPSTGVEDTLVTIVGSNFSEVTDVTIDGDAVSFSILSSAAITFTAPDLADGAYEVEVTNPYGSDTATFTYDTPVVGDPPVLTSLLPASGPSGTSLAITGTSLAAVTAVTVGGNAASHTVNSANSITATAPAHADGAVSVFVEAPLGTSNSLTFTYTTVGPSDPHPGADLLLEDGSYLLLEDGSSSLLLES